MTLEGQMIREFASIKEATTQTGVRSSGITACCQGRYGSCGGYQWRYSGSTFHCLRDRLSPPKRSDTPVGVATKNRVKGITYYDTPRFVLTKIYERQKSSNIYRGHGPMPYTHDQFVERYLDDPEFLRLFRVWRAGGCKQHDIPSFDRSDVSRGYALDNLRLMTWGHNREKGKSEQFITQGTSVYQLDVQGDPLKEFVSMTQASRIVGVSANSIGKCCRGERTQAGGYGWRYSGKFRLKRDREEGNYGEFFANRQDPSVPLEGYLSA